MSMNLYFETLDGAGMVDFPFQTPTELTYAVLKEGNTPTQQVELVRDFMTTCHWPEDDIKRVMSEMQALMDSPHLQLTLM